MATFYSNFYNSDKFLFFRIRLLSIGTNRDKIISIETLITFFAASILLALAPGPDNIFVTEQ